MPDLFLFIFNIFLLILLSAFFSSSETALTAVSEARIHELSLQGNKRARIIEQILLKKEKMISTILIGNNLVNIVVSVYATSFAISFFGEFDLIFVTILLTVFLVIFAEVIPKTYAFSNSDKLALNVAPVINFFIFVLTPATFITERFAKLVSGPAIKDEEAKTEELRGMIRLHAGDEIRGKERGKMMSSMLDMDDVTIEAVMTHRGAVTMIDIEEDLEIAFKIIGESPYTRIPIYSGTPDNIIGILHAKELFRTLRRRNFKDVNAIKLSELMIQPYFAPETTLLLDQLEVFKTRREHFAVVVDEYGDFRGIITLEDIIEEIVGEIDDETDIKVKGVKPQPDGSFIIDGSVTIRDLNRSLGWYLPDQNANTIAGLVLHESKTIPEPGQEFRFYDIRFRILQKKGNFISQLRLWNELGVKSPNN
ncbi:MAG: HlyC/CorC family transporter [Candidatus Puniceispirillales bacterium]|jgi:Mg2+/Co2+ transporter CorB|nr:HlyC/CorC family transporter [Alphaproteobacteria bacterium]